MRNPKAPASRARRKRIGAAESQSSTVPKYRGSITLKAEIAALLESSNIGIHTLILDDLGVVQLLKAAIEREGSISAFAKRHGLERSYLSSVLNGKRPVSSPLVKALGLRKVYALQHDT
jgi:hypothetical protein